MTATSRAETNSNQGKFKRHFEKAEQNKRDWKDKQNRRPARKPDDERRARLRAEGRCFNCEEKDHRSRDGVQCRPLPRGDGR